MRGRSGTAAWVLGPAAAALLAALAAAAVYRFYLSQARLPLWDMAGHGWGGVSLLQALAQGRPLRFLDLLNRQDKWPFGYSLLLLPFLALGRSSFASATLLSAVLYALAPPLLLTTAREVDRGLVGLWGGLLAASLFLAAPLPRVLAILVMREMAGIVFSLLASCLYLRARRVGAPRAWRLAGLSFLALFLVKYNYALVWGVAVLANEIWRLPPERRRELVRRAVELLRPWGPGGWKRRLLAVYLDLLIAVTLLDIDPGVGVYAGLVAGGAALAVRVLRRRDEVRERWRRLPVEIRAALATVVFPLWIWCLSPRPIHPRSIFQFLRNRTAGPPLLSLDALTYYFRALARDYAPTLAVGAVVLLLAALACLRLRRGGEPFRVLALTAVLGTVLATLHPYKEPRFLAVTAPYLMLAGALELARAVHGYGRPARGWMAAGGLLSAAAVAAVGAAAAGADLGGRLARDYALYSGPPALRRPLDFLAGRAAGARRAAVVGTFNELSESLVRWRLSADAATRNVELVPPPSRFAAGLPRKQVRQRLRRWFGEERPQRILAVRLLPSSPLFGSADYQRYNAWQLAAIAVLERNPAWRVSRRRLFPGLGMEIAVLERAGAQPTARSPSPHPP